MSGRKIGRARLTRQVKRDLAKKLDRVRKIRNVLAKASNAAERVKALLELSQMKSASNALKEPLRRASEELVEDSVELRETIDSILNREKAIKLDPISEQHRVTTAYLKAEQLSEQVDAKITDLDSKLRDVFLRTTDETTREQASRTISKEVPLRGLLAEIRQQQQSGVLKCVEEQAASLYRSGLFMLNSGTVTHAQLEQFQNGYETLLSEAEKEELSNEEQLEITRRLGAALEGLGYRVARKTGQGKGLGLENGRTTLEHFIERKDAFLTIKTDVLDETIQLEMLRQPKYSPGDPVPDQECVTAIGRIAETAKALGVTLVEMYAADSQWGGYRKIWEGKDAEDTDVNQRQSGRNSNAVGMF